MNPTADSTTIVVVNYGTSALVEQNLAKTVSGRPTLRVVVVDNFTDVEEQERLADICDRHGWALVKSPSNVGFGSGMNLGVAAAIRSGAKQLLLLNPDAWIDSESLAHLERRVIAEPLTMVGPVIRTTAGSLWSDGHDLYLDRGRMRATRARTGVPRVASWLSGACLMMSVKLWDRVGGFEEQYFLYWEDVDLSWRVTAAGGALKVLREATAVHDEGGTQDRTSARALSDIYYYYNIRNRLIFATLHLGPIDRWRWALTAVPEAWAILLRGGRRQLRHLGPWRAGITGTAAGILYALQNRKHLISSVPRTEGNSRT